MKYAFLDRDGTLIHEPYDDYTPKNGTLLPGVSESLLRLSRDGFTLVMITNQDNLGTNANPLENFDRVQKELLENCGKIGIIFSDIFICPHGDSEECVCRKPKTTLLDGLQIDKTSIVVGDRKSDELLAQNLAIQYIHAPTNLGFAIPLTLRS